MSQIFYLLTTHLFTSSSKNLLLLTALMTLNLFVCITSCFQFYISTLFILSLTLCFLLLFKLFYLIFSGSFHAFEVLLL